MQLWAPVKMETGSSANSRTVVIIDGPVFGIRDDAIPANWTFRVQTSLGLSIIFHEGVSRTVPTSKQAHRTL
jgi:hypothetical protein